MRMAEEEEKERETNTLVGAYLNKVTNFNIRRRNGFETIRG